MTLSRKQTCFLIAVTGLICLVSSCTRKDPNIPKVVNASRTFNERFNSARFHEIYSDADPRFQHSISEAEFTSKLNELLQQHGLIEKTSVNGFDEMTRWERLFPESKPTRFVGYYNHCQNGGFQELFQFDVTGEEAKLLDFDTDIDEHNKK